MESLTLNPNELHLEYFKSLFRTKFRPMRMERRKKKAEGNKLFPVPNSLTIMFHLVKEEKVEWMCKNLKSFWAHPRVDCVDDKTEQERNNGSFCAKEDWQPLSVSNFLMR